MRPSGYEIPAGFSNDIGLQDESYFDTLVRMFEQALKAIAALPHVARPALLERLDVVRNISTTLVELPLKNSLPRVTYN